MKKKAVESKDCIKIKGEYHPYKDFLMDEKGYVLIRTNKEKKLIELGFCKKDNEIDIIISGKTPQEIYNVVCKKNLLSRNEHYAYLGKELQKAYTALKHDLDYMQDEELKIKK